MENTSRTEYRITGRFRMTQNRHVVDRDSKWTLTDAQNRLRELQDEAEWKMTHKNCKSRTEGMITVSTEYHSDYDLLDLRIESREITPWKSID